MYRDLTIFMKLMKPRHHCVRDWLCAAKRPLPTCVTPRAELLSVDVRHLDKYLNSPPPIEEVRFIADASLP